MATICDRVTCDNNDKKGVCTCDNLDLKQETSLLGGNALSYPVFKCFTYREGMKDES